MHSFGQMFCKNKKKLKKCCILLGKMKLNIKNINKIVTFIFKLKAVFFLFFHYRNHVKYYEIEFLFKATTQQL